MISSILWFIGAFCVFTATLAFIEFLGKVVKSVIQSYKFDVERFKTEVNEFLKENALYEKDLIVEELCENMMDKFPEIDSINYYVDDTANTIEFTVTTKNLKVFSILVATEDNEDEQ